MNTIVQIKVVPDSKFDNVPFVCFGSCLASELSTGGFNLLSTSTSLGDPTFFSLFCSSFASSLVTPTDFALLDGSCPFSTSFSFLVSVVLSPLFLSALGMAVSSL
jgi:hypothetical protein